MVKHIVHLHDQTHLSVLIELMETKKKLETPNLDRHLALALYLM